MTLAEIAAIVRDLRASGYSPASIMRFIRRCEKSVVQVYRELTHLEARS